MGGSSASAGDGGFQQEPTRSTLSKRNQAKVDRKNKKEANVEMGLGNDRMSNYSTSQGGTKEEGDGSQSAESGNNTITQVTKTAPTEAEVSQATTAEADADTEANRLLKIKKRGRSMTMMSGSQGVKKTSADYSLGKTSLLGRV